jgi:hypothetical protein
VKTLEKHVLEVFPNAIPGEQLFNELIEKLKSNEGFDIDKTLLGLSICPDETNATVFPLKKYFPYYFFLGGLSGYPFTGKTGVAAFASHVPENGYALILYGPHIGITRNHSGVGVIIRKDHGVETTCCGALINILDHIKSGNKTIEAEDDYQIEKMYQELFPYHREILSSQSPVLEITRTAYRKIKEKIKIYTLNMQTRYNIKKVALVGGIMINTDHGYPDFFEVEDYDII